MNLYVAIYSEWGAFSAYRSYDTVLSANSESEALGFALTAFSDTDAEYWEIHLVNADMPGLILFGDRAEPFAVSDTTRW